MQEPPSPPLAIFERNEFTSKREIKMERSNRFDHNSLFQHIGLSPKVEQELDLDSKEVLQLYDEVIHIDEDEQLQENEESTKEILRISLDMGDGAKEIIVIYENDYPE